MFCVQKVGVYLNKRELAKKVILNKGGIAKTSDFVLDGIKNYEVAALCKEGVIERIRRGFYQLPQNAIVTDEQILKEMLPRGIICVESALFHYGYSDFSPRKWSVAVPRTDRERMLCDCFKYRTKLDNEIFNKAVNAYALDNNKNLVNLSRYAKEMKLYTKVMNVMEVLLNG